MLPSWNEERAVEALGMACWAQRYQGYLGRLGYACMPAEVIRLLAAEVAVIRGAVPPSELLRIPHLEGM